jgi:hypothetical protein
VLVGRERLAPTIRSALLLWGVPLILLSIAPSVGLAIVALAAVGIAESVLDVSGRTLLQRLVPGHTMTRAFGILEGLRMAGVAAGSALVAVLINANGARVAMVVAGLVLPMVGVITWRWFRAVDEASVIPTAEILTLSSVAIFQPLRPVALECIALNSTSRSVSSGDALVHEGDAGSEFFVIVDGRAVVTAGEADQVVNRLGPADYFGEIALLHDRPRTATVTAATDMDLLVVERDDFIRAVTGHSASRDSLDAEVDRRLQDLPGEDQH